jgi:hypothetical protein
VGKKKKKEKKMQKGGKRKTSTPRPDHGFMNPFQSTFPVSPAALDHDRLPLPARLQTQAP